MANKRQILLRKFGIRSKKPHLLPNVKKITSHCHPTNDPDHNEEPDFEAFVAPDDNILEASFSTIDGNFNHTICANFRTYIDYAYQHLLPFTHAEASAIRLLIRLRQTKASLQTYESVMEWHLK